MFWGGLPLCQDHHSSTAGRDALQPSPDPRRDVAAILFTSGSTGAPKGAVYSHGNFAAQVQALREVYGIEPGEIDLPTFPLFALFAPALGMTAVIPDMDFTRPGCVDPDKITRAELRAYCVTTMFGSPALLNRVGRYGVSRNISCSIWPAAISAGAPVPARCWSVLRPPAPGVQIFTPYGATEAFPVSSIGSTEILAETRQDDG